jgi:hypothetical protein
MRGILGTTIDLIFNLHTVAFKVVKGTGDQIIASEFAKFIVITYCVIDQETEEEFYTKPITFSMN